MRNEVLLVTGSRQFLFFTRHLIIIWIRKGRIQFFFLIYIRQETNGMEQPAGIECIVFFIFRIETADVHIAQRMYKHFYPDKYRHETRFPFCLPLLSGRRI